MRATNREAKEWKRVDRSNRREEVAYHSSRRLEVGRGPGCDKLWPEDHLLGDLAPHAHVDVGHHLLLGRAIFVLIRHLAHHAERVAPGDDGRLVDGLGARSVQGDERVPAFVVRREPPRLLALRQGARRSHKYLISRLV